MSEDAVTVKALGIAAAAVGGLVYAVRYFTSRRETPNEVATREILSALEKVAEKVEELQRATPPSCPFLHGSMPEHVENAIRLLLQEAERAKGRR